MISPRKNKPQLVFGDFSKNTQEELAEKINQLTNEIALMVPEKI